MEEKFITITGFQHYNGIVPFQVGKTIKCVKEPKNPYDSEAIIAMDKDLGKLGYVANSPFTVACGTMSAGRIYEKVGKKFWVKILFITPKHVIGRVMNEAEVEKMKHQADMKKELKRRLKLELEKEFGADIDDLNDIDMDDENMEESI